MLEVSRTPFLQDGTIVLIVRDRSSRILGSMCLDHYLIALPSFQDKMARDFLCSFHAAHPVSKADPG